MIKSPCIKVCKIDIKSGLCWGSNRTMEEIKDRFKFEDKKKRKNLSKISERRELFLKHKSILVLNSNKNHI